MQDRGLLEAWAGRLGVQTAYFSADGQHRVVGDAVLHEICAALGDLAADEARDEPLAQAAFQGNGARAWILAVQLYSLRSLRNWGIGDFTDLAALLEVAAEAGAAGIGLNPLHALFLDRPEQASPYSPNSRLFLNPLYIDIEAIPEYPGHDGSFAKDIAAARNGELINYGSVGRVKRAGLEAAFRAFQQHATQTRRGDLAAFRAERGESLARFCAFETYRTDAHPHWLQWPLEWRAPTAEAIAAIQAARTDEYAFHEFLQWTADRQLAACRDRAKTLGLSVGLYVDMAVGVDPCGADAWLEQQAMMTGLTIGAPPDLYNTAGQNWGLTSYSPSGLVAAQFEPLRLMLRAAMRHAGAIRLDHVLGLMRIYVLPHGRSAADGAYLAFPFAQLLAVIAEESRAQRCIVIGEDLGTVPEGFRALLQAWGVWSYLVMLFERDHAGAFRPPESYPAMALATLNTHDMATHAGWTSGADLAFKRGLGIDPGETDDDRARTIAALRAVVAGGENADRFAPIVAFLAATPARLVQISVEDILGVAEQINVPGTIDQHPNWRRRLPCDLDGIAGAPLLREIADVFRGAGRADRA